MGSHCHRDPLPPLLRQEKDWGGFLRGRAILDKNNKPALQMLGGLRYGHELHRRMYHGAKCTAWFYEEVRLELLQSSSNLLKLTDLGFLPPTPCCHNSSRICALVSPMPHFVMAAAILKKGDPSFTATCSLIFSFCLVSALSD